MDQQEPTIVEKLEADAAVAKVAVEQAQKDLAGAKAAIDAKAAEIEAMKAAAVEAAAKAASELAGVNEELAKAKADTLAALELATKAEARAKAAEGALARDPEAMKLLGIAGTIPVAGTSGADSAGDKSGADDGASLEKQWMAAMKAAGGDFIKAKKDNPELYARLIPQAAPKS